MSGSLVFVSGDSNSGLKGNAPDVIVIQSIGYGIEVKNGDGNHFGGLSQGSASADAPMRSGKSRGRDPDFVADEIIVKYRPGVDPGMLAKSPVSTRYAEARSDRNTPRGVTSLLRLSGSARGILSDNAIRDLTLSEIERIRTNPLVEYAEPNYIYRVFSQPVNDPDYPFQWHYPLIKLDKVWSDIALPAGLLNLSGITVAVIDTGIAGGVSNTHLDLTDTPSLFRDQYDFYSGDGDATDDSSTYHGTHVTGTIAALTNNGVGVAGVAGGIGTGNGARIMPLRALSDDGGTSDHIAQAILYAAGLGTIPLPPSKAQIINMSFGGSGMSQTLADAIHDAYNTGLLLVAAAGNEATDLPSYPAAYPEVISVGAVTPGAEKAYYSNFSSILGSKVDISAPGGSAIGVIDPKNLPSPLKIDLNFDTYADDVLSTYYDGSVFDYAYLAGTSMATPHVAGAAALVMRALQIAGNLNPPPAQIKGILTSTAVPLGPADFYGAGLLDVYKAVNEALVAAPGVPVLSASPKTLRLYGSPPRGNFILKNTGKAQDVAVTVSVLNQSTPGFASVTPGSAVIPSGSSGISFTVTASPGPFPPSLRYAEIEITSPDARTEHVYVMHKDTGTVYVVAFRVITFSPLTTEPAKIVAMSPSSGFDFSFTGLGKGNYLLGASTDRDGDGQIFDAGEAYGFYGAPDYDNATLISLDAGESLNDLNLQIIDWE